jgi:hypothetical protein
LVLESAKIVFIAGTVVLYNPVSLQMGAVIMGVLIVNMGLIVSLGIQRRSEFLNGVEQVNKSEIN